MRVRRSPQVLAASRKEWLDQADNFLPPELAASLREQWAQSVKDRLARAEREAERARAELAEIEMTDGPALGSAKLEVLPAPQPQRLGPPLSAPPDDDPSPKWSVAKLIQFYARKQPGRGAGEFVSFVQIFRRSVKDRDVHNSLYKLAREGGPQLLRKEGEKPHTRYYLNEPASQEAKPTRRR